MTESVRGGPGSGLGSSTTGWPKRKSSGRQDRIELLGGHMIVKEPQHSPHATSICLVQGVLMAAFGAGWTVRAQMPVALDEESEPEPDVSVVPGDPRDYRDAHPERPALIVEVALSRLRFDREHKGSLYARAGIVDYWIVNIPDRRRRGLSRAGARRDRSLRLALRPLDHTRAGRACRAARRSAGRDPHRRSAAVSLEIARGASPRRRVRPRAGGRPGGRRGRRGRAAPRAGPSRPPGRRPAPRSRPRRARSRAGAR